MATESIGMMEGAFFVSKNELISWVNSTLSLHMTKVEQMASGAAYCQLMDILFPGSVPLSKINWMAKYDHEFLWNYKFLQMSFDKNKIHKNIEVDKLIKGKYQDNLEFLQWFKRFFDLNCKSSEDYNPVERRKNVKTLWDAPDKNEPKRKSVDRPQLISPRNTKKCVSPRVTSPRIPVPPSPSNKSQSEESERIEKLEKELKEAKDALAEFGKEREFFFNKLRTIEVYCDHHETAQNEYLMDIQKILFASESDKVVINENGSVLYA